jgi:hypothetical protein
MVTVQGIQLIKDRRAAIEQERAALKRQLARLDEEQAKLKAEETELAIAERVLGRLTDAPADAAPAKRVPLASGGIPKNGSPRPDGIPTVAEMIDAILADAATAGGRAGLTGRELVVEIAARWWPGVGWNNILPTALRLVEKKRLGRKGDRYLRAPRANGLTGEGLLAPAVEGE